MAVAYWAKALSVETDKVAQANRDKLMQKDLHVAQPPPAVSSAEGEAFRPSSSTFGRTHPRAGVPQFGRKRTGSLYTTTRTLKR